MYKSEQLAHNLKLLIENGSWQPHTKLPSLREQVQRSGFSLITVMNAYQELEAQGLIYSKEKSGYFVAEQNHIQIPQAYSVVSLNPKIEINSLVFKYLKSIQSSKVSPLGSAFPDSQLLYPPKLIQIMGQLSRNRHSYDQTSNLPPGNLALRKLIAQLFQPFFSTKIGRGGTGLGMTIVENLVKKTLGGTIAVESSEGAGSTFLIRFPKVAPSHAS